MGQETGSKIETTSTITGGLGEKVTILCEGQRSTPGYIEGEGNNDGRAK